MRFISSPYSPARCLYFKRYMFAVYRGYLSQTARNELEGPGNEVIRLPNCWIIRGRDCE